MVQTGVKTATARLIAAISADPRPLEGLLVGNAAFTQMLEAVYSGLLAAPAQEVSAALANLPEVPDSSLRQKFNKICVQVPYNRGVVDVAVPQETFNELRAKQRSIAQEIGGGMGTRDLNRAVANYLLDREAFHLLAEEGAGPITEEQRELLKLHREKWREDGDAEARAKMADAITEKEAALLEVYRTRWVRDTDGLLVVLLVRVVVIDDDNPNCGALVVCSPPESK
jgi:hypothetical protein